MQALEDPSDAWLLQAVARKEEAALEALYNRWAPRLAHVMRAAGVSEDDVADLLQIVFLEIWSKAHRFQPSRGGAAGWMFQLARSRTIDFLRRQRRRAEPLNENHPDLAPNEGEQAEQLSLHGALATLSPRERAVLELAYFGGFSLREISTAWGVPLGSVKTWGHRGLKKLRRIFSTEADRRKAPP